MDKPNYMDQRFGVATPYPQSPDAPKAPVGSGPLTHWNGQHAPNQPAPGPQALPSIALWHSPGTPKTLQEMRSMQMLRTPSTGTPPGFHSPGSYGFLYSPQNGFHTDAETHRQDLFFSGPITTNPPGANDSGFGDTTDMIEDIKQEVDDGHNPYERVIFGEEKPTVETMEEPRRPTRASTRRRPTYEEQLEEEDSDYEPEEPAYRAPARKCELSSESSRSPTPVKKTRNRSRNQFRPQTVARQYHLKKESEKDASYRIKRERNNDAVRKSRNKMKEAEKKKDEDIKHMGEKIKRLEAELAKEKKLHAKEKELLHQLLAERATAVHHSSIPSTSSGPLHHADRSLAVHRR